MESLLAWIRHGAPDGRPDDVLLAAFLADHDERAFAEVVRRHGPVVWGACRRMLPDPADSEDAFQAAFLVLVRRGYRTPAPLGPWLHRVAVLTARGVRRRNARRLARARPLPADLPAPPAPAPVELDGLLVRLPEKYRAAIVLCCLEGLTEREAAGRVGCPVGTLSARLSRGLARLRALIGADPRVLLATAAAGAVPAAAAAAAVRTAVVARAAEVGVIPYAVSSLSERVVRMFWLKTGVRVAAGLAMAAVGVRLVALAGTPVHTQPADPPGVQTARLQPALPRPTPPQPAVAPTGEPKTPAEKLQALVKAHEKAEQDFSDAYRAAKTDAARQKVSDELAARSMPEFHAGAFLALMKEYPTDPVALDACRWLVTRAANSPEAGQAVALVLRDWIEDARLGRVCEATHPPTQANERLLRGAIAKSPHRDVQGLAHYSLAKSLRASADRLTRSYPEEREPLEKEADQLLLKVIDRYADLKHVTTLGEEAEQLRFELRHLGLGKTPPDIEGEDLDGKKLKLRDYRGKVTLVVFWAGWCGPCMADVPHERELLMRYEGKPFAIVGVNGDQDRAAGKAAGEKAFVPWRSFADCQKASSPIAKRWNVSSWPTLYLLDGTGTIRFKGDYLRSVSIRTGKDGKPEQYRFLDEAVEQLMKEAEKNH